MEYTQPTSEIETDKTKAELAVVVKLRNNATVLQGEVVRLKELLVSTEYTIRELLKQKEELSSQIEQSEKTKEILNTEISELMAKKGELAKSNNETEENIKTSEEYIKEKNTEIKKKEEEVRELLASLLVDKKELEVQKDIVEKKDKFLNDKLLKLKELI